MAGKQVSLSEAIHDFTDELDRNIQELLTQLLEKKHLYQKVKIDQASLMTRYLGVVAPQVQQQARKYFEDRSTGDITLLDEHAANDGIGPVYRLRNLKLYCRVCLESEVASCVWSGDVSSETTRDGYSLSHSTPRKDNYQLFVLAYQCQRCKSDPTVFIIRRSKWHLSLDGRSPMEEVSVNKVIPAAESNYFRESLIASQSGKALPALLYLRIFIEVFCRRQTGMTTRESGDELTDRYAKLIPTAQREQMPSLKEQYGRLSEAIHDGRDDSDLYEQVRDQIIRHFEFRRLFQIKEV